MKPNIEDTDIIIRRAANGWIVFSGSAHEADHFMTTVYEDSETTYAEHKSLICLIRDQFFYHIQSKKQAGIKLEVRETGYTDEEEE